MTTNTPRTESSTDPKYRTTIHNLTVSRTANAVGARDESDIGRIERVEIEVTRSKQRDAGSYHRTVTYVVDDGVARVAEIAPRHPDSSRAEHAFRPGHVAAMLAEADTVLCQSVPEIESVRTLSEGLRNERVAYEREHTDETAEDREAAA